MMPSLTQRQVHPSPVRPGAQAHLLVVGDELAAGPSLRELLEHHTRDVERVSEPQDIIAATVHDYDAVVLIPPAELPIGAESFGPWQALLDMLDGQQIGTLIYECPGENPALRRLDGRYSCRIHAESSVSELLGRLEVMIRYRSLLRNAERELDRMERLGNQLKDHFAELDQELRLASRLQRDFLPRELPQVGPVRFAAAYHPARWVSGDLYNVERLDEHHVGFYVADAVGHGIAAGLLTMFIRQALPTKRIEGETYQIIPPDEAMAGLNNALADQHLPNCQFATACYCIIDTRTLELTFARGGHPYPLVLRADGSVEEMQWAGPLLGVFPSMEYPACRIQLRPGDKVLVYTDGAEPLIVPERDAQTRQPVFEKRFLRMTHLPAEELTAALTRMLQNAEGSLTPEDDVTFVVMEVSASSVPN